MTIDIEKALLATHQRGLVHPVVRKRYDTFSVEECLRLADSIGKERDPKFVLDDENIFAYTNFIKWLHADPTMQALNPDTKEVVPGNLTKGIYIGGNTGTGKSWCMEIMATLSNLLRFQIAFGQEETPIYWRSERADGIVSYFLTKSNVDAYKKTRMLCIQDFGSEPLEAVSMGNRQNVLRMLLEHRGDVQDSLTFITSNFSLRNPSLATMYGDRVVSRLNGMCNYFEIKGKDRRKI